MCVGREGGERDRGVKGRADAHASPCMWLSEDNFVGKFSPSAFTQDSGMDFRSQGKAP